MNVKNLPCKDIIYPWTEMSFFNWKLIFSLLRELDSLDASVLPTDLGLRGEPSLNSSVNPHFAKEIEMIKQKCMFFNAV